jgi:hypothetical protein
MSTDLPSSLPREMLGGDRVLRVSWLPGSDRLRGRCHCGVEAERDDPVVMWEWLLAHPDHPPAGEQEPPPPAAPPRPPAHLVTDPARLRGRTSALV